MGVLTSKATTVADTPLNGLFVIYGSPGTGKTVLASSFPKTKEAPMLYLDILEGGTASISLKDSENIIVVPIETFDEMEEVLEDVLRGWTVDENGAQKPIKFSTIVIDSATQLQFLLKERLKKDSGKTVMNQNLWGMLKDTQDQIFNLAKIIYNKTGAYVVTITHQVEIKDDNNPQFNKIIPSLNGSNAYSLCAKSSFVWYTKIETEQTIDPATNNVVENEVFYTYIDAHPYLLTKCQKPKEMPCPQRIKNLTFQKFKSNIMDKIKSK